MVRRANGSLQRHASAACLAQPRRAVLAVSGEGAQLSSMLLRARARRAALVVASTNAKQRYCAGKGLLCFSARPWCNVPATASNIKPAPRVSRVLATWVSLGRGRSTRACCPRAPCRAGCCRSRRKIRTLRRRKASFFRRTTVVQRASCSLQRQASAACLAQRRRSLGKRRNTRSCCTRAPCRAGCDRPRR